MATNKLTAGSRGYIFLGSIEGAPDFSKLGKVTKLGQAGSAIQEVKFEGESKPGNMLQKGYLAVGPYAEVEVEIDSKGIRVTPDLNEKPLEVAANA